MKKKKAILYDATTGEKIDILKFVEIYNQWYYFSTSRWVEFEIEQILKKDEKSIEDFLNIFAWKTGRINHQKCELKGEAKLKNDGLFFFTKSAERDEEWGVEGETAIAITRRVIKEDKNEDGKVIKTLYSFLSKAHQLSGDYTNWIKNNHHIELDTKGITSEEKEIAIKKAKEEAKEEKQQEILKDLRDASLDGIGSVYLVTFLYFITKGEAPIYDFFAMTALDAIYQDGNQKDSRLGSVIKPRDLPAKDQPGFDHLLDRNWKYGKKTYLTYKTLLNDFLEEYNAALKAFEEENNIDPDKRKYPVNYASFRDIDRALWVYGHLFRDKE